MKHIYFFITLLILLTTDVTAQVTLTAANKMVRSGDSVFVEIRAKTRDSLSTLQFTLSWNPALLSFGRVDTSGGIPPSAISDEINFATAPTGKITFTWITTHARGQQVVDSVEVFKIFFKAIGLNGTNSVVKFDTVPTKIKASNANLVAIPVTIQDGSVKIGTTATIEQKLDDKALSNLQLAQNRPNPFQNQTIIPFTLTESDDVILSIYDFKGQLVLEKKGFYALGTHEMVLNTEGSLANGFYVYRMKTHRAVDSKVFLKN